MRWRCDNIYIIAAPHGCFKNLVNAQRNLPSLNFDRTEPYTHINMDHSEARTLVTPFGPITIYHLSGESGWKAVSSDIPPHGLRMTRSGIEGQSSYASDCFLTKFCHEVGLITSPRDGDLQLIAADLLPSFDPESVGQLGIVWSERITSAPTIRFPEPVPPRAPRSILRATVST